MSFKKYQQYPTVKNFKREWADKQITQAAIYCSVDLRDGNQALINPLTIKQKIEYFNWLVKMGFKNIEVSYPSASDTDFNFTRKLIEEESSLSLDIKKYLDENYLEEFILEDLAKKFDLSVVHLIRVFKKEFGLPIHSYILNKKVHKAKELLSSNIPVSLIAQNSGFFDQSHLNRSFKRIFQITPKEYQKHIFSKC